MRYPPGWRKIVETGGLIPLFKKVIAKMNTQEIAKYEKLAKDYFALEKETTKAWQKGHEYDHKIEYTKKLKKEYKKTKKYKNNGYILESELKYVKVDVPLAKQKKVKKLYKTAEMIGLRALRAYNRYDEFYNKMMKKYY